MKILKTQLLCEKAINKSKETQVIKEKCFTKNNEAVPKQEPDQRHQELKTDRKAQAKKISTLQNDPTLTIMILPKA